MDTDLSDPPGCTNRGPGRLAQKMSVVSVGTSPPSAHRTISFFSGGARSPARFAPPRGRGGDRSVPRGCPELAAPLGPAGGAGSAHPLRTRRLGRGARRGLGLRLACVAQIRRRAGFVLHFVAVLSRLPEVLSAEADGEKGCQSPIARRKEEKHRAGRLDKTRVASTRPRKGMPPPPPPPRRATGRSANRSAGSFLPHNLRRDFAGYCLVGGRREQQDVR